MVVTIAVAAGCVPTLQPILLGGLLGEGRIGAATVGQAATTEALGMVLGTTAASAFLPCRNLRLIGAGAILAVLAANLVTIIMPADAIVAARGLSGLGNGVLLWLFVGMLARSAAPTRLFAVYITANASGVFALSLILTTFAVVRYGALSGYGMIVGIYAALLMLVRLVPGEYDALADSGGMVVPPPSGLIGLGAIVLQLAGVMAMWVYSIPLGVQAGIAAGSMQMVVSASIGVQVVAGLAAIALAAWLTGIQVITGTAIFALCAVLATMLGNSVTIWLPAMLTLAFCWIFCMPFHLAFLVATDPSKRAAMFVGTAQLGGLAVGPLLASSVASSSDYGPARTVSIACFAGVLVIAAIARRASLSHAGIAA